MTTRLVIDWIRCDARGACTELLPELLVEDDWGYPLSRSDTPAPAVPRDLRDLAQRAVTTCPRQALRLVEDGRPT